MKTIHCVPARKIKRGEKTCKILAVTYDRNHDGDLPLLTIDKTSYHVEETFADVDFGPGRAFLLHKIDPEDPECYSVFVSENPEGFSHYCDCMGFTKGGYCKHVDALDGLLKKQVIPHPFDGEWEEIETTTEQDEAFAAEWDAMAKPVEDEPVEWSRDYEYADATPFSE